jgi:signal transduction histidine kinase
MPLLKLHISRKKNFYLLAGFSMLIVFVSISLAVYTITNTNQSITYLDRSHDINLKIESLMSLLKDAESGQRGYIITHQFTFLEVNKKAQFYIGQEFDGIYKQIRNDSSQRRKLNILKQQINEKLNLLTSEKQYYDERGEIDDSLKDMISRDKAIMDKIKHEINQIQIAEQANLVKTKDNTFKNSELSIYIIVLTCGLSLVLLLSLLIILNREYHSKLEIEKELMASRSLLEQQVFKLNSSNKELEQFAYVASHDLQEPLRKIISFSEKIEVKLNNYNDEDISNYLRRLNKSADRMRTLINDLLNYSRATRALDTNEDVPLDMVFKYIMEDLEVAITSKNIKINTGNLKTVNGNNTQLRQLFQNLVSNALKFNHSTVPVVNIWGETYTDKDVRENEWGKGFSLKYDTYYCIFINDNGIGFEPEYLNQIFIIFQRLHGRAEYEGTGIGLAICKRIVENHEGFITAESTPGNGATFIVGLPKKYNNGK